jgi:hypothetical protein
LRAGHSQARPQQGQRSGKGGRPRTRRLGSTVNRRSISSSSVSKASSTSDNLAVSRRVRSKSLIFCSSVVSGIKSPLYARDMIAAVTRPISARAHRKRQMLPSGAACAAQSTHNPSSAHHTTGTGSHRRNRRGRIEFRGIAGKCGSCTRRLHGCCFPKGTTAPPERQRRSSPPQVRPM